jgi:hypothetical protein
MQNERYPLPFGWIKQVDQASGHPYYVDTKATPPRSIWTHPYEDDVYLKEHPDVREKINAGGRHGGSESDLKPPSFEESQRRHSFGGASSSSRPKPASTSTAPSSKPKDRRFFGKLKDKAIGTKEEREAEKRRRREEDRIRMELQQQRMQQNLLARQQYYASQPQYVSGYGAPAPRRGGLGGGGLALPLLGGLAGGLLLGDVLDGGFGGGDFGGGDFGGGF